MKTIVGAGLAGLIAAHAWPRAQILEAAPEPVSAHKALLRFRSDAVARLVGIDFRKVRVNKGIWLEGEFISPNIRAANLYAQKVLGAGHMRGERSIWNIAPVDRFIAPEALHEQLLEATADRVTWNHAANFADLNKATVSTAPLPIVLRDLSIPCDEEFHRASITVKRWRVKGADVFQTVYFPDQSTSLYRASITGDLLIAEFAGNSPHGYTRMIERAFGIDLDDVEPLEDVRQQYGKIEAIDDATRKQLLFRLTHEHGIYSLGRFATWRNILLDEVVDDISAIKRLARTGGNYELRKASQ